MYKHTFRPSVNDDFVVACVGLQEGYRTFSSEQPFCLALVWKFRQCLDFLDFKWTHRQLYSRSTYGRTLGIRRGGKPEPSTARRRLYAVACMPWLGEGLDHRDAVGLGFEADPGFSTDVSSTFTIGRLLRAGTASLKAYGVIALVVHNVMPLYSCLFQILLSGTIWKMSIPVNIREVDGSSHLV
jgi:hypothetical protein